MKKNGRQIPDRFFITSSPPSSFPASSAFLKESVQRIDSDRISSACQPCPATATAAAVPSESREILSKSVSHRYTPSRRMNELSTGLSVMLSHCSMKKRIRFNSAGAVSFLSLSLGLSCSCSPFATLARAGRYIKFPRRVQRASMHRNGIKDFAHGLRIFWDEVRLILETRRTTEDPLNK